MSKQTKRKHKPQKRNSKAVATASRSRSDSDMLWQGMRGLAAKIHETQARIDRFEERILEAIKASGQRHDVTDQSMRGLRSGHGERLQALEQDRDHPTTGVLARRLLTLERTEQVSVLANTRLSDLEAAISQLRTKIDLLLSIEDRRTDQSELVQLASEKPKQN